MSSGYQQTLLLDCNRLSSEEYNASKLSATDNSLYTNKVSNGIHLNIGDTVSINSAYISERGAGAEVIEFKGKDLGPKTQITYTNVSNTSFVGFGEDYNSYVLPFPDGFGIQEFSNITVDIPIKDNQVSIAVQFYKNTNGEMNITLPRRYGSISPAGVAYATAKDYWTKPDNQNTGLNTFSQDKSHIYAPDWNPTKSGNSLMYVTASNTTIRAPTFNATTGLPASTINGSAILRKIKQDNSRYTIFVKDKIVWAPEFITGDDANELKSQYLESRVFNEGSEGIFETSFRDPAMKTYIPYMKKIDLSVGAGYDTPSNIASTLTDTLIKADDPIPLRWNHRGVSGGTDVYANKINSTLYQEFPGCNPISFDTLAYDDFIYGKNHRPDTDDAEDLTIQSFNYINNYAYVGFKRPELVVAGRKLNESNGFHITEDINFLSATNTVIKTSLEWTPENLENLRDFFEVQGKFYRELISGNRESNSNYDDDYLTSIGETSASLNASFEDVARFLHINPYSASTLESTLIFNGSATSYEQELNVDMAKSALGNDMGHMPDNPLTYNGSIVSQTFSTSDHTKYDKYPYDLSSLPIYIYYNASSAHLGPDDSDGNGDHNLVYGFARKYQQDILGPAGDFIALTTEKIGGIHANIFQDGTRIQNKNPDVPDAGAVAGWPFISGTEIKGSGYYDGGGRRLGYDYHFNAYGNAAILLNTGYTNAMYYGHQQKVAFDIARGCYLGADNPLLNFNSVTNRFEFQNLHTSEKIGNYFNSGDPSPAGNEIAPPPAAGEDEDCYKINKVDQYNCWSPSMMPFPDINVTKKGNVSHTLPEPNPNMERDVIMDSHCGITITDMGVTEELWDESIWGILGFSYSQFYPNASIVGNINTRMNNVIINVSGATTNALVTSDHCPEYNVNPFGTTVYTTQQALATDYGDTANWMLTSPPKAADYKDVNTIVIAANSTAISATSLPRKQLRGYFLLSSNIMSDANYYREANPLQVMAVVDKYNAEGDFINYSGGGTVFTVTKPTTITSVRTAILDPDGSPAQVGQYSGVIYRIDKQINTDLNFAQTIMEQQQQKK
jgi:hypothetical protein